MRYLSLFSGIEAASVAWAPLGWECVAVAEIEPFPCSVLRHHYPDVPNLGDVTAIGPEQIAALGPIDLVVFGSPCFTAGHVVLTERGLIPIESVVIGDSVWTHASRWRRVTDVMTRTAPTVVLNGQGHNAMRATPDHPFYASHAARRVLDAPEWVPAKDMAGRRWATPINIQSETTAPAEIESTDGAYLAGAYVGDGHIGRTKGRNKKSVILSVGTAKLDRILPRLQAAWGTVSCLKHGDSVWRLQLSRTSIAEQMLQFGCSAASKTVPTWVFSAGSEWLSSFLQGVLDTDGSPVRNGHRVTTVSRSLAVGLRLIAARLGYSTSMHFTKRPETHVIEGRVVNQRDTWTVYLRKGNRASEVRDDAHSWGLVRTVRESEEATVYDITVDEDHSFVCDGLVVHNCQDLSVAGKRKGLAGERSGLFHTAIGIIGWARVFCGCRFALWENVPGAFTSNQGRDFAAVVGALAGLDDLDVPANGWGTEGAALGDEGLLEWGTLDAQWFGVAQRRRRVFALADFGDWQGRPPVLLEPDCMRGDSPPSRSTGKSAAGNAAVGVAFGGNNTAGPIDVATARNACSSASGRMDFESETVVVGVDLQNVNEQRDVVGTLDTGMARGNRGHGVIAYGTDCWNGAMTGDVTSTVTSGGMTDAYNPTVMVPAQDPAHTLASCPGAYRSYGEGQFNYLSNASQVRRLTPTECERLQGFPDGYTHVPHRKKRAKDGPRYKALGNSMAVPVMAWIGKHL